MITKDTLDGFFANTRQLKSDGKARFDIDDVCRWSFFLVDTDRGKLTSAGRFLEDQGYEIVGFLDPNPGDENQSIFLRFDRVERHTPDTLFDRNAKLYEVAKQFGVEYDGMDVGAPTGP